MDLAPLLAEPIATQIHAAAAILAFVLGILQFAAPKGTLPHRTVGWIWVLLMTVVAVTAFFIHGMRMFGPWSPIHLLAILVLVMLPLAVIRARQHRVRTHSRTMTGLFLGALVIAGLFTLVPGRVMHTVLFGG
ncbi:membrane protein [Allostella sp. ATCC 35155]|nr:membrane protein [Stella sp. ATCC 35155]